MVEELAAFISASDTPSEHACRSPAFSDAPALYPGSPRPGASTGSARPDRREVEAAATTTGAPSGGEGMAALDARNVFSSKGPGQVKGGAGASEQRFAAWPRSASEACRKEAFQWFFTALSVRPGSIRAISAQRLPCLWCSTRIVRTSSTVKGAFDTSGSRFCCSHAFSFRSL